MWAPRPVPPTASLLDPLASDVAYSAATIAVTGRCTGDGGRLIRADMPSTQVAGIAVSAAAPFIVRDLLALLDDAPWWRRGQLRRRLLADAVERSDWQVNDL